MCSHRAARLLVALLAVVAAARCTSTPAATELPRAAQPDVDLPADSQIIPARITSGATLGALLRTHDVVGEDIDGVLAALDGVFDARKFRTGQAYRLERVDDGRIRLFEYEIDGRSYLSVVADREAAHRFEASVVPYDTVSAVQRVDGAIDQRTPSLFDAMAAAGEAPDLPIALADVFAGEVDFNSELQDGDRFRVIVEKVERRDGRFVGYEPIAAAELINGDRRLRAIRFTPEGGKPGYFDEEGRSLKRFFLRSPLKFDPRVTSGFSRSRRHPILNIRRAHLGVDYRAGTGAPVVAVAHGTVIMAAWTRGGGRTVKIRHAGGYETAYLHLSAFGPGIRAGVRVSQGQLIGRVGSTGLATGPHLHYALKKNGRHVNPIAEHRRMPPGDPVPADQLEAFRAVRDELLADLEATPADAANAN